MSSTLPAFFEVGVSVGLHHGGGQLVVAPNLVAVRPGRVTRFASQAPELTHQAAEIRLRVVRLLPPFMNIQLLVEDRVEVAVVTLPCWSLRRLRSALAQAGFTLEQHRCWLARRRSLIAPRAAS